MSMESSECALIRFFFFYKKCCGNCMSVHVKLLPSPNYVILPPMVFFSEFVAILTLFGFNQREHHLAFRSIHSYSGKIHVRLPLCFIPAS